MNKPEMKDVLKSRRKMDGTLLFYGDCFAHQFYGMEWNKTLCRKVFEKCKE